NSLNPPFDFMRLGLRVPAIVVSPWIPAGTIDHTQYDHASIAATARKLFLGSEWQTKFLTARDQIANAFDWNLSLNAPRTDQVDFNQPHKAAAMARAANPAGIQGRIAKHAGLPLSDLQQTLVAQSHFVNQHGLPPDRGSDLTPSDIHTEAQASAFHAEVTASVLGAKAGKATS